MAERNEQTEVVEHDQVRLVLQALAQEKETSELEEGVVALLNVAVPDHRCLMCGQGAENHAEGCPIEGLELWLNPIPQVAMLLMMGESRFLVPAAVEHCPLPNGHSRLSILWSNGQRGKLEGPEADMRKVHDILLQAMTEQTMINVARWPGMKVGNGYEHDW